MRIETRPTETYAAGMYARRIRISRIASGDDFAGGAHGFPRNDYAGDDRRAVHANDNQIGDFHRHSMDEISGPKIAFSSLALAHLIEARDSDEPYLIDPREDGIAVVAHNRRSTDRPRDRVIDMSADARGVYQPA